MKVPLSWLREFVPVELPVDELVDLLGMRNLEVEEVRRPGLGVAGVHAVRVLAREPHPDADKLQVVTVTDGADETTVVCGAWNFDEGDLVLHAPPGSTIPGLTLEARSLRGVRSHGMLLSARELEAGDDHVGLLVLPDGIDPGTPAQDVVPFGEPVIEIAVQADRGDHLSILGVARDVAAILDLPLTMPTTAAAPSQPTAPVTLEATGGCSQFVAWALANVSAAASPLSMRFRLAQCGMRPIDNVVDVTNYVMLELGQPLHAFDLDRLDGPAIVVRWADPDEALTTLDGLERTLQSTDVVVADASRAVALAGVMGGAETEVGEGTRTVLLEAATWDPLTIRRTSRSMGLLSEASLRFERRVDPAGAERALGRAVELLRMSCDPVDLGITRAGSPRPADITTISYDAHRYRTLLGLDTLAAPEQAELLQAVGCEVVGRGPVLAVKPPTWRGDLQRPVDLAEEVARLHGYEHIPAELPATPTEGGLTTSQAAERDLLDGARAGGFHEVKTRPFVGDDVLEGLVSSAGRVTLANPLARDAAHLRPTLLPGLISVLRHNRGQGRPGMAVFEYGRVFRPAGDALDAILDASGVAWRWSDRDARPLPTQPRAVAVAAQGRRVGERWLDTSEDWSVYDVLATFDEIVRRLTGPETRLERRDTQRPGLHPGRTALLFLEGIEIGVVGQLHPDETSARDLSEPVVVGELLVDHLLASPDAVGPPRSLVRHPAVSVDVALVASDEVPFAELESLVRAVAGDVLDELWWFDEYRGEQIGTGRRSVALRLRLQRPDRQLTDEDAEHLIEGIAAAAERVGATLRR